MSGTTLRMSEVEYVLYSVGAVAIGEKKTSTERREKQDVEIELVFPFTLSL